MNSKRRLPSKNGSSEPKAIDDFKLINGVGPAVERRLREAGICSFAQLAALTTAGIVYLLSDMIGMSARRIEQQDWLGQASEMASAANDKAAVQKATPVADRQHNETFTISLLLDDNNRVRRTRVIHVQDGDEQTWAGWEEARLSRFIVQQARVQQAGLDFQVETEPSLSGLPGLQKLEIVRIDDGRVENFVRHNQPYQIRLVLDLSQVALPDEAKLNCTAIIYAKNLKDHSQQVVGEAVNAITAMETVSLTVPGRPVPMGLYRLEARVILNVLPDGADLMARLAGGELFQVY